MSPRDKIIYLIVATTAFLMVGQPVHASRETEADDLQRQISAIGTEDDPGDVGPLVADVEAMGKANKDAAYYHVVVELCNALNSSTGLDSSRKDIARQLAAGTLSSPDDMPLFARVGFLMVLAGDFEFADGLQGGDAWRNERLRRLQLWLETWQRIQAAKHGLPPVAGGPVIIDFDSGTPGSLTDPSLGAEYEKDRAKNQEKAVLNMRKGEIDYLERQSLIAARFYVVDAYGQLPFDTEQLEKTLQASHLDGTLRSKFIDEVNKNVAARAAHEKTLHDNPPGMHFIDIPPPRTAVYHPDLRLRKLVTFQLAAPKVEDVLEKLREGTGVRLTRAADVQNEYPAAGSLFYSGIPAWRVMDELAGLRYVEGRWEKDGDGYRLVRNGNPVAPPAINEFAQVQPSPGWQRGVRLVGIALTTAIIGVLLFLLIRRKRLATS